MIHRDLKNPGDYESHYKLIKRLGGASGMGQVYLAFDENLEREVAIKYPSPQTDPTRFFVGGKAAAKLNHPNIIKIYYMSKNPTFMVMEYLAGGTLRENMKNPSWDFKKRFITIEKVLAALSFAHKNKVVHRDLKPENIMFDIDKRPVVVDFDLSKLKDNPDYTKTIDGTSMGTPPYMSPEQVRGKIDLISYPSDIYSMGVIIFEIMLGSGKWPINGETVNEIMINHINSKPDNFYDKAIESRLDRYLKKNIIKEISNIIDICLKKDVKERGITASELLSEWKKLSMIAGFSSKIIKPAKSLKKEPDELIKIKCPSCGFLFNNSEKYCPNCGMLINKTVSDKRANIGNDSDKKICPSCGFKNNKSEIFCNNCGAKLSENKQIDNKQIDKDERFCVCGEKIVPGVKFCPNCGKEW